MTHRIWPIPGLLGALMILGSGVVYVSGAWPHYLEHLQEAGLSENVIGAVRVGWFWGATGFVAFGLMALLQAIRALRGRGVNREVVGLIASAFVIFGLWAVLSRGFSQHTAGFIACGLLVGSLLMVPRGDRAPRGGDQ